MKDSTKWTLTKLSVCLLAAGLLGKCEVELKKYDTPEIAQMEAQRDSLKTEIAAARQTARNDAKRARLQSQIDALREQ